MNLDDGRLVHKYFVLVLATMLVSCSLSEPSIDEMESFYLENTKALNRLVEFCEENQDVEILRLDEDKGQRSTKNVKLKSTLESRQAAREILIDLEQQSLRCDRNWSLEHYPLFAVSVALWGQGLSISGSVKGLSYFPTHVPYIDTAIQRGELFSIDGIDGWYAFHIESH